MIILFLNVQGMYYHNMDIFILLRYHQHHILLQNYICLLLNSLDLCFIQILSIFIMVLFVDLIVVLIIYYLVAFNYYQYFYIF